MLFRVCYQPSFSLLVCVEPGPKPSASVVSFSVMSRREQDKELLPDLITDPQPGRLMLQLVAASYEQSVEWSHCHAGTTPSFQSQSCFGCRTVNSEATQSEDLGYLRYQ